MSCSNNIPPENLGECREIWRSEFIKCNLCTHAWIDVFEASCIELECPNCHNMTEFELITQEQYVNNKSKS